MRILSPGSSFELALPLYSTAQLATKMRVLCSERAVWMLVRAAFKLGFSKMLTGLRSIFNEWHRQYVK